MTSIIKVDTIQNKAGSTSLAANKLPDTYTGSDKCWVNFTGSSPFQIEDSFNTSSITDNSTGRYNVAQTNNFANAHYTITHGCHYEAGNGYFHSYHAKSTTTVEFLYVATTNAYVDTRDASAALHGDLA